MAEVSMYSFTHQEVAAALVKQQGIHEGIWGIYIEFGFGAGNIGQAPNDTNLVPAAIIPITKIGIQRFPEPNNLTVDAEKVNPPKKSLKAR